MCVFHRPISTPRRAEPTGPTVSFREDLHENRTNSSRFFNRLGFGVGSKSDGRLCKQIKSQDFYLHRRLPVATLIWSVSFRGPRRKSGGRSTMLERSA
jgi:hypothetical protein